MIRSPTKSSSRKRRRDMSELPNQASKRIVVFADGTGNAFSTQESNVWRLYRALDRAQGDQIAYYIKGVGTSGFRPYALLDGATGIGVPSNVRKLYRFICWNWNPGDQICMFGFSRGSFTIRTLIGLIHHEGLLPYRIDGETISRHEMDRNVMAAWRSYRAKTNSNSLRRVSPLIPICRAIRDLFVGFYHFVLQHRSYKEIQQETKKQNRSAPRIKFAGLFDTVEAFGVPIEEFRRAIDWAIWPISFSNKRLSDLVDKACHALSLDDERKTFHPIRFEINPENKNQVEEVWFAGVHSDVGGGYPDADLAYVPLLWMAEHAVKQGGLRFTTGAIPAFLAAASAVGPRHDSRAGLGVFYRYGPRVIYDDAEDGGPPVIHHAVAERMVFGCDGYAPIVLPSSATILLPDGSRPRIRGFQPEEKRGLAPPSPEMMRALAAVSKLRDPDPNIVGLCRDRVWWRRVAYFTLLGSAILAFSLPWTAPYVSLLANAGADAIAGFFGAGTLWTRVGSWLQQAGGAITAVLASILALVGRLIPGYAKPWVDALSAQPIVCLIALAAMLILYRTNGYLRDRIADLARQAWFPLQREQRLRASQPKKTFAQFMRTSRFVSAMQIAFSDFLLPGMAVAVIYLAMFIGFDRSLVSIHEGRGDICRATDKTLLRFLAPGQTTVLPIKFQTRDACWPTGVKLEKDRHYTLRLTMDEGYFDSTIMSDIAGFQNTSWEYVLAIPFRRWWSADWFEPIARIGSTGDVQWKLESLIGDQAIPAGTDRAGGQFDAYFYTDPLFQNRLSEIKKNNEPDPTNKLGAYRIADRDVALASTIRKQHKFQDEYVSDFVASTTGELFLYVNDVMLAYPWKPIMYFYRNNRGSATVIIQTHDNPH
jgi:uncharacterized protein (DUF2235 family)